MKIGSLILAIIMAAVGFIGYKYTPEILANMGLMHPNTCVQTINSAIEAASCVKKYNTSSIVVSVVACALLGGSIGAFANAFRKNKK